MLTNRDHNSQVPNESAVAVTCHKANGRDEVVRVIREWIIIMSLEYEWNFSSEICSDKRKIILSTMTFRRSFFHLPLYQTVIWMKSPPKLHKVSFSSESSHPRKRKSIKGTRLRLDNHISSVWQRIRMKGILPNDPVRENFNPSIPI